jgi:hypothetical protein
MGTTAQATEAIVAERGEGIWQRMDLTLRRLNLLERSATVKRLVELGIRGVEVEPIPPCLGESKRAVLVSNYPAVYPTLRALIKVGARFPGQGYRLKGIGRPEVIAEANTILKVLGVDSVIFPVYKDEAGAYRMQKRVIQDVMAYLQGEGNVLWLSLTGATRGNGLLEGDLRTGAALFSTGHGVPLVPMGLVTREHKGRPRVVKVRFGEPINPTPVTELSDFERTDFLIDLSRLALCRVASLLPPGQRGDFEQVEEKLQEAENRLGMG